MYSVHSNTDNLRIHYFFCIIHMYIVHSNTDNYRIQCALYNTSALYIVTHCTKGIFAARLLHHHAIERFIY